MDFSRISNINFKDPFAGPPTTKHLIADIVIVDKTVPQGSSPRVYQLNQSYAEAIQKDRALSPSEDLFTYVGEVISISRQKRLIYLKNECTVTYNFLIVVGKNKNRNLPSASEDLVSAVQTLQEAIRVHKQSIPLEENMSRSARPERENISAKEQGMCSQLENIIVKRLPVIDDSSFIVYPEDKRLIELHI